jgi:GxxExxY protein
MVNDQRFCKIPQYIEDIGKLVVDSAYKVHVNLGPGLLERHYKKGLLYELVRRNITVQKEVELPLYYNGVFLEDYYRVDLLVEDVIIVELKSVEQLLPVHFSQVKTYLKLSNRRLGYLINFNTALAKDGINRVIL